MSLHRRADTFKAVNATTGTVAAWTPSSSTKRWRLLAYRIMLSGNATVASGATNQVALLDVAAQIGIIFNPYVPAAAPAEPRGLAFDSGWVDLGGIGIVAAAVNTALNFTPATALTAGSWRIHVAGVEE